MRREDKFGYGFLLASIGVPVLIVVIWGEKFGAAVAGSVLVVVGVAFLIAGHIHKEGQNKRRSKMSTVFLFTLVGIFIGGAIGLLSGISYVALKKNEVAQNESPKADQATVPLIEAGWDNSALPITVTSNTSVLIVKFLPDRTVDAERFFNGRNFNWLWPTKEKIKPPELIMIYRISNHDKVRLYNMRTRLLVTFTGKDRKTKLTSSELEIKIDSLAPGESFPIYLVNESEYYIKVPLPEEAILQVEGSTNEQRVKIVPHGLLSDIPDLPFRTDNAVVPLFPSTH